MPGPIFPLTLNLSPAALSAHPELVEGWPGNWLPAALSVHPENGCRQFYPLILNLLKDGPPPYSEKANSPAHSSPAPAAYWPVRKWAIG